MLNLSIDKRMVKRGVSAIEQIKTKMRRTIKMYLLVDLLIDDINKFPISWKQGRNDKKCRSSQEVQVYSSCKKKSRKKYISSMKRDLTVEAIISIKNIMAGTLKVLQLEI